MFKKIFISFWFSLVLSFLLFSFVFSVEEEISWSSANKAITDSQLKTAISSAVTDVTNEDFSTYSYTSQYNSYNYLLNNYISVDTYSKAFISSGEDGFYFLQTPTKFQLSYRNSSVYREYYYTLNSVSMYYFDINNKTISSVIFGGLYTPLNNLGWDWTKTDITINEFETTAYKQNMIYNTFFLVLGPIYDNVDTSRVLNSTRSYKVDGNMYENIEYTGEIVFSEKFETWQTRNLSESFTSGEYYYYIDAFYYDENGVSASNLGPIQRIGEGTVTFNGDSVYLPSVAEVNEAIKQYDGYMNYAYNIVLTRVGSDNELFLSSDLFIVDAKPIAMIPYFKYKYNYIYYGSYIDIGESGDTGSGDIGGGDSNSVTSGEIADIVGGIVNSDTSNINSGDSSILTDNQFQITDPTENIVFSTFQNIANVMTSIDNSPINTTFMGKPISLKPDVWKVPDGPLKSLFVAYFSYWVGKTIILDIRKTINKFKEGNFESIATEDITANMV